jgi:hypothetical protein
MILLASKNRIKLSFISDLTISLSWSFSLLFIEKVPYRELIIISLKFNYLGLFKGENLVGFGAVQMA